MLERGANLFILMDGNYGSILGSQARILLSNLPIPKSIYFCIRPHVEKTDFPEPWYYKSGVFDGQFRSVLGKGASGTVLSGQWYGKKAAFKFVEIEVKEETAFSLSSKVLKDLDDELLEMTSMEATQGSKIVSFYGHFR